MAEPAGPPRRPSRRGRLAIHGHFYQPPRWEPFGGTTPPEPAAAPAHDWTERIAAECYRPNAERGNFGRIGWDVGPTLASWLAEHAPDVLASVAAQDRGHNGTAQGYWHAILPLCSPRDRRTEIAWGLRDFELRFGRRASGFWLPETAVDLATLEDLVQAGIRYTILAPWQAARDGVDTRRPYRVALQGGRSMIVFFFDAEASAAVSFDRHSTRDADRFAREVIAPRLAGARPGGRLPLLLIATDGEVYGHHQRFRDLFLERLTTAPDRPFELTTVGRLMEREAEGADRLPVVRIAERTSWSCHHGIARWTATCPDARDGRWKAPLRAAYERLATAVDAVSESLARDAGADLWQLRAGWVDVLAGVRPAVEAAPHPLVRRLVEAQVSRLAMFASDAWFWEDPVRDEARRSMLFAAHAARTVDEAAGTTLEAALVDDLRALTSPSTGLDGAELYRRALASVGR